MDEEILSGEAPAAPPKQFDGNIGMLIELLWRNVHFTERTTTWTDICNKGDNHFVFQCPTDLARAFARYFDPKYVHVEEHPGENWCTVWHTKWWGESKYRDRKIKQQELIEQEEKRRKDLKLSAVVARERRFKRMIAKIIGIGSLKGKLLRDVENNWMHMIQLRFMDHGEAGVRAWIAEREEKFKGKIYEQPTEEESINPDSAIQ